MSDLITRVSSPAPKWFRKTKRALTLLSDTAIVILLSMGYAENSLILLYLRVGLSGVLQAVEAILVDPEN